MEVSQIKTLYDAMIENDYESLEVELKSHGKLFLKLEKSNPVFFSQSTQKEVSEQEQKTTQIEIKSDKVGVFSFASEPLQPGEAIKKNQALGFVKGISFQDKISCSVDGTIESVEVNEGDVVDFGRLLFVVNLND